MVNTRRNSAVLPDEAADAGNEVPSMEEQLVSSILGIETQISRLPRGSHAELVNLENDLKLFVRQLGLANPTHDIVKRYAVYAISLPMAQATTISAQVAAPKQIQLPPNLPSFSPKTNIHEYFKILDNIFLAHGTEDAVRRLSLISCLRVNSDYHTFVLKRENKKWEELKTEFIQNFRDPNHEREALGEIVRFKFLANESPYDAIARFNDLVVKSNESTQNKLVVHCFISGVPKDILKYLEAILDLNNIAIEWDKLVKGVNQAYNSYLRSDKQEIAEPAYDEHTTYAASKNNAPRGKPRVSSEEIAAAKAKLPCTILLRNPKAGCTRKNCPYNHNRDELKEIAAAFSSYK